MKRIIISLVSFFFTFLCAAQNDQINKKDKTSFSDSVKPTNPPSTDWAVYKCPCGEGYYSSSAVGCVRLCRLNKKCGCLPPIKMGKPSSQTNIEPDDKNSLAKQATAFIKCPCEKEVYAKTTADCKKICDAFKSDKEDASIFADTVLLRALNTGSPSIEFSIKQPEKTNTDVRTKPSPGSSNFILSLSSNDNSHEFNELWVYKKKNKTTLAIFYGQNSGFKPNGSFFSSLVKPFKAAIDSAAGGVSAFISVIDGIRNINVNTDGTWTSWYDAGTECDEDDNCLLGILIKGIRYKVQERLRVIQTPDVSFFGMTVPGFPNVEIQQRYIFDKCGCKN